MNSASGFKEEFLALSCVPHETHPLFERYASLLVEWNKQINLVSASTIPQLWSRHMADSAQLAPLIPEKTRVLVDLGSGAGFPGLVLAILGVPEVHLVESVGKKAKFLAAVVKELKLNVTVHNERAEKIKALQADVVTARAVTALPDLLSMSKPFMGKESLALFLKGEKAEAELTEARKYWTFNCKSKPSQTDASGMVLAISELKIQRAHERRSK